MRASKIRVLLVTYYKSILFIEYITYILLSDTTNTRKDISYLKIEKLNFINQYLY